MNGDRAGGAIRRVLMVNKFHYPRGGAEHYMFRLAGLLEGRGAHVDYFAMHDSRNLPCDTDRYFVSEVDFEHPPKGVRGRARVAGHFTWPLVAARYLDATVAIEGVDAEDAATADRSRRDREVAADEGRV